MQQTSPKVFLCHAKEDESFARKLHSRLVDDGVSPWFDEVDLLPGQDWDREIEKAIRSADVFLACLSENAIHKRGYVQRELKRALHVLEEIPDNSIYLVPVRIQDCVVPDSLAKRQWVDLFPDFDVGYERLMRAIRAHFTLEQNVSATGKSLAGSKHKTEFVTRTTDDSALPIELPIDSLTRITNIAYSLWEDFAEFLNLEDLSKQFREQYRSGRLGGLVSDFVNFVSQISTNSIDTAIIYHDLSESGRDDLDYATSALFSMVDKKGNPFLAILIDADRIKTSGFPADYQLYVVLRQLGHVALHWHLRQEDKERPFEASSRAEAGWFASQIIALNGI